MLILNLGCGHPGEDMPDSNFVNLDRNPKYGDRTGWTVEDRLERWPDGSVNAVTISHLLMYVSLHTWHMLFDEIARVLKPCGVVRITEDVILDPASRHWGGHDPLHSSWKGRVVTGMSPLLVIDMLELSGILAVQVDATESHFTGADIRQDRHGGPPHVFYVEGMKE